MMDLQHHQVLKSYIWNSIKKPFYKQFHCCWPKDKPDTKSRDTVNCQSVSSLEQTHYSCHWVPFIGSTLSNWFIIQSTNWKQYTYWSMLAVPSNSARALLWCIQSLYVWHMVQPYTVAQAINLTKKVYSTFSMPPFDSIFYNIAGFPL